MSVRLYLSLCCGWTAPVVSEEEGIYALRFHCWCLESLKSCLLLLMALPGLIDTLAQLKVPAMIAYDVATKLLDTESFPKHNIAGLISGITFIVLFSTMPLSWKKTHTQTHTHACMHPPTHTHTHTHTHTQQ